MKLSILLGMAAAVSVASAALTIDRLGAQSGSPEVESAFSVSIRGAVVGASQGRATFGPVNEGRALSIELGARDRSDAILFTREGAGVPVPGTYRIGEVPTADEFSALLVAGVPEKPEGAFRAVDGTLTITESSADRVSGSFRFRAVGFLASAADADDREVTVTGTFTAGAEGNAVVLEKVPGQVHP